MYLHFAWQSSFIIFYFWKKRFLCTADNLFESFSQSFTVRSKFDGQYFFHSSHKYLTTHNLGYYNHRSNNFILWNLIRTRNSFPEFLTTALDKSHHSPTQQLPSSTSDWSCCCCCCCWPTVDWVVGVLLFPLWSLGAVVLIICGGLFTSSDDKLMADTFGADTGLARLGWPGPGLGGIPLLITCCCVVVGGGMRLLPLTFELAAGLVGVALLLSAPSVFFSKWTRRSVSHPGS